MSSYMHEPVEYIHGDIVGRPYSRYWIYCILDIVLDIKLFGKNFIFNFVQFVENFHSIVHYIRGRQRDHFQWVLYYI